MEALISKQRALLLRVLHHVADVQHWPMKAHEVSRNKSADAGRPRTLTCVAAAQQELAELTEISTVAKGHKLFKPTVGVNAYFMEEADDSSESHTHRGGAPRKPLLPAATSVYCVLSGAVGMPPTLHVCLDAAPPSPLTPVHPLRCPPPQTCSLWMGPCCCTVRHPDKPLAPMSRCPSSLAAQSLWLLKSLGSCTRGCSVTQ